MRRLLVAALAVVLVGLVGCSAEGPKADPAPEPSASESVVPKDETAEEFIRRWFQVQEDMQNSGDSSEYVAMARECVDCAKAAERITDIYAAGGDVDYGGDEVTGVERYGNSPSTYEVTVEVSATEYSEKAGAPRQQLDGGTDIYAVTLSQDAGGWQVNEILALN